MNIQALGKFNHNAFIKLVSVPRQESDWQFICVLRGSIIIIIIFFLLFKTYLDSVVFSKNVTRICSSVHALLNFLCYKDKRKISNV